MGGVQCSNATVRYAIVSDLTRSYLTYYSEGDMVYLNVLGQGVLIIGSQTRAVDLLVKRAVKWSSRPAPAMLEL
jgi:hypothetical protein